MDVNNTDKFSIFNSQSSIGYAVVMGLGRFGGGVGAAKFLHSKGYKVLVTDLDSPQRLKESVAALSNLENIEFCLGQHRASDFAKADIVVVNPAVKPDNNKYIKIAQDSGAIITSAIQLLIENLPDKNKIIGVTGTAGKSTVSAMIAHILTHTIAADNKQKVHLGGNFGGSLLERVGTINENDWVVLELSSFMLHWLSKDKWSPHIAVITNIYPNHLDWHKTFDNYVRDKSYIAKFQTNDDTLIMRESDTKTFGQGIASEGSQNLDLINEQKEYKAHRENFAKLNLSGDHNFTNAIFALHAAVRVGVLADEAWQTLYSFKGLPHRLQLIQELSGVVFFNDSKSTTPQAAIQALGSFESGKVHLILGGYDKGSDLSELVTCATKHCAGIYTIGATGATIAALAHKAKNVNPKVSTFIHECENLPCAVSTCVANAKPGDIVLLSPACASWDQFENYQQRGAVFIKEVQRATNIF